MFNAIRKKWNEFKARRRWLKTRESFQKTEARFFDLATATDFFRLRTALGDCIDKVLAGKHNKWDGICFNAGFMGWPAPYKDQTQLFLKLAERFVREVYGEAFVSANYAFPFKLIDYGRTGPWDGYWDKASFEVRMRCMTWIIKQIDEYKLDGYIDDDIG